tara:strand:- start:182 stop:961 length:780 start_codon:yes stop_codon:yes gene_type:complete
MKIKTVLLRGKIFESTQQAIDSIRTWFDGELILSTWKHQKHQLQNLTKIIYLDDPGPGPVQQSDRQLISYKEGLSHCQEGLTLVTRSDICHFKDLSEYFNIHQSVCEKYSIFEKKVVVGNMMTINPDRTGDGVTERNKHFRICDWFQVGLKNDLNKWCASKDYFHRYKDADLCTEQIWLASLIHQFGNHQIELDTLDKLIESKHLFWDYLLNNFRVINMRTTGQALNMNWAFQPQNVECYMMEEEYEKKYNELLRSAGL